MRDLASSGRNDESGRASHQWSQATEDAFGISRALRDSRFYEKGNAQLESQGTVEDILLDKPLGEYHTIGGDARDRGYGCRVLEKVRWDAMFDKKPYFRR
ncbi:hypothetical protein AB4072_03865 [Microvirga sp. 2MCAF38]|uniref:hypothetical protein n=1 Tax=Microvirga sp. 2MCAF38 TaxID=3232989 RepID=UPI003F9E94E8